MTEYTKIRLAEALDGKVLQITLAGGKGNVIDRVMARELSSVFQNRTDGQHLRGIVIDAEGPHFSFGASVPEHTPELARELLDALHTLIMDVISAPVPVAGVVKGACLGGALELVIPCHRIFAAPDAKFALPEITLGMYAPAGSLLLPARVRRPFAEDMLLTGRTVDVDEALREGLIDEVSDDPKSAAAAWFEQQMLSHSAMALRFATRAARCTYIPRIHARLRALEDHFVSELMQTVDAREGVKSFMEKRSPVWMDA